MFTINNELLMDWGISLEEYEKGEWGTAVGSFKVPATIIKRFRKEVTNADGSITSVFDKSRAFNEVAITYLSAVYATYDILRKTKISWFKVITKENVRKSIYNAIEYASLNRQFWENVNGSNISNPNFSVSVDSTGWLLTTDMFGMKALNYLTNSGIANYEWVTEDVLFVRTGNGNVEVVGWADIDKFPELA